MTGFCKFSGEKFANKHTQQFRSLWLVGHVLAALHAPDEIERALFEGSVQGIGYLMPASKKHEHKNNTGTQAVVHAHDTRKRHFLSLRRAAGSAPLAQSIKPRDLL